MGIYSLLIRPFARKMDAEQASRLALRYFKAIGKIPGGRIINRLIHKNRPDGLEREVFGLSFYNPVGLGSGLDINGDLYNDLNDLGFSFVEIGPMNSLEAVRHAIANLQNDPQDDILAVCISGNYTTAFSLAYDFCDFFVIDMGESVETDIFDSILDARLTYDTYKPVVAKVPEDISRGELESVTGFCMMNGVDGIEVRSIEQIEAVNMVSKGRLPIIANCHTITPEDAHKMLECGASLVEVRSGLLYDGPGIVGRILKYLSSHK